MKATIDKRYLVIRIKLCRARPSRSGKSMIIASSRGPRRSGLKRRGKEIRIVAVGFYLRTERQKPRATKPSV